MINSENCIMMKRTIVLLGMASFFCLLTKGQTQPQNRTYSETELWPSSSTQAKPSTNNKESEIWPSEAPATPSTKAPENKPKETVAPKAEKKVPAQQPAPAQQKASAQQPAPAPKPNMTTTVTPVAPAKTAPRTRSSYIVKTKGVKPVVRVVKTDASG